MRLLPRGKGPCRRAEAHRRSHALLQYVLRRTRLQRTGRSDHCRIHHAAPRRPGQLQRRVPAAPAPRVLHEHDDRHADPARASEERRQRSFQDAHRNGTDGPEPLGRFQLPVLRLLFRPPASPLGQGRSINARLRSARFPAKSNLPRSHQFPGAIVAPVMVEIRRAEHNAAPRHRWPLRCRLVHCEAKCRNEEMSGNFGGHGPLLAARVVCMIRLYTLLKGLPLLGLQGVRPMFSAAAHAPRKWCKGPRNEPVPVGLPIYDDDTLQTHLGGYRHCRPGQFCSHRGGGRVPRTSLV